jgi:hypothetical protein
MEQAHPPTGDPAALIYGCADDLRTIAQIAEQVVWKLGTVLTLLEEARKEAGDDG